MFKRLLRQSFYYWQVQIDYYHIFQSLQRHPDNRYLVHIQKHRLL